MYCLHHPSGEAAAGEYVSSVLRVMSSYDAGMGGGTWPVHHCVYCSAEALVADVLPVGGTGGDGTTVYACFACGYSCTDGDIGPCERCGVLTDRLEDGFTMCEECIATRTSD